MTDILKTKVLVIGAGTGGYDAAEFIQKVKGLLEHPATLFMD